MIPRRVNENRRLVSYYDNSFILNFTEEQKSEYYKTLKIESLGSMADLGADELPTIFVCKPLSTKWEHLSYGAEPNYWGIFQTHVKAIENSEVKLEFEEGIMTADMRELFPPVVVVNIAKMIVEIANSTAQECFFMPSDAALHYGRVVKVQSVGKKKVGSVRGEDAKNSVSK